MKVLILMAGRGSRFSATHPDIPKPLISLHGQPLVRWVIENLKFKDDQEFIFVALKEHVLKYSLHELFTSWKIRYSIVEVSEVTQGAACSALLGRNLYQDSELIIANGDQFVLYNSRVFYEKAQSSDGLIMTMNASGFKWSYVKEENGLITEVREKDPISDQGTVGIYYFRKGSDFIMAAEQMIQEKDKFNNEYYLAPTYNYLIRAGKLIRAFNVGEAGEEMIGLGTSEDFLKFESDERSKELAQKLW